MGGYCGTLSACTGVYDNERTTRGTNLQHRRPHRPYLTKLGKRLIIRPIHNARARWVNRNIAHPPATGESMARGGEEGILGLRWPKSRHRGRHRRRSCCSRGRRDCVNLGGELEGCHRFEDSAAGVAVVVVKVVVDKERDFGWELEGGRELTACSALSSNVNPNVLEISSCNFRRWPHARRSTLGNDRRRWARPCSSSATTAAADYLTFRDHCTMSCPRTRTLVRRPRRRWAASESHRSIGDLENVGMKVCRRRVRRQRVASSWVVVAAGSCLRSRTPVPGLIARAAEV